jgi:hypothetical protein
VDGGVPVVQGSLRIAGDALLEVEQRVQIDAVLVDRSAMDLANSVTEQQQRQEQKHGEFRRLLGRRHHLQKTNHKLDGMS